MGVTDGAARLGFCSSTQNMPTKPSHVFTYRPLRTVIVQDFMQWVCENGRDAFEFSPEWEGCRFWLTVVMQDVEDAGWLDKGSADQPRRLWNCTGGIQRGASRGS